MTARLENKEFKKFIKPIRMKYKNEYYEILASSIKFLIKKYKVRLVDGKLNEIYVDGEHPNSDPLTNQFCIPDELRFKMWDESLMREAEYHMAFYNLDDCYFEPEAIIGQLLVEKMNIVGGIKTYDRTKTKG